MSTLPTAELHVHLEGTAPPELVRVIAARNGVPLPDQMLNADGRFRYTDFLDFLRTYDMAASVIRTGEDYRDITYEYLCACARGGAIYVELTASPDHARLVGLSDEDHWNGIARGIDEARRDTGIEGRILISAVRNFGVEQALRVAEHAAEHPHPYVVGFSMAGDEQNFPAGDFAEAYRIAADAGLGCTIHAGEWAGPRERSRRARASDHADRSRCPRDRGSGAGRRAGRARGRAQHCPTSNVVLGVYPSYEEHPLARLRAAGVKVTLGSDDPPYFGATLQTEYELCVQRMGLTEDDLRDITRTAIEAAFCDDGLRTTLRTRL